MDQLIGRIDRLARDLEHQPELLRQAVKLLEGRSKAEAPKRTRRLERSIHGDLIGPAQARLKADAFYDPYVQARNPYMARALARSERDIERFLREAGARTLEKLVR